MSGYELRRFRLSQTTQNQHGQPNFIPLLSVEQPRGPD